MKKIIFAVLAMMLIFSSAANAGFLDWLFSGFGATGAQTLVEKSNILTKEPEASFKDSIADGTYLRYNIELSLKNNGFLLSSYNPAKKTATLKFTKKIAVADSKKIKFDNGYWTTKLGSGYIAFKKGESESLIAKIMPKESEVKDSNSVKSFLINVQGSTYNVPIGKSVVLSNGFTARAFKESDGTYSVSYTKSVTVSDNAKILLPSASLFAKVTAEGVTFAKSPAAPKNQLRGIVRQKLGPDN